MICRGPCSSREEHSKLNRDRKSDGESDSKSSAKVLRKRQLATPLVAYFPNEMIRTAVVVSLTRSNRSHPSGVESRPRHLHALHHILQQHSRLQVSHLPPANLDLVRAARRPIRDEPRARLRHLRRLLSSRLPQLRQHQRFPVTATSLLSIQL